MIRDANAHVQTRPQSKEDTNVCTKKRQAIWNAGAWTNAGTRHNSVGQKQD
jgi:hypothetical protein